MLDKQQESSDEVYERLVWFGDSFFVSERLWDPEQPHDGFAPYLIYRGTLHFPQGIIQLKTGWAQDVWLQWSHDDWYFHLTSAADFIFETDIPNEPFPNFRASKSVDRRILCSSWTSCDGF